MSNKTDKNKSYHARMLNVVLYIQNNLDKPLTLESLAEIAAFSPHHFHHIFTAYKGESVKQYIRRLRLERSINDLAYTQMSITDIAHRAGYDTQQSFHRAFHKIFKITPNGLRQKKRVQITELIENYRLELSQNEQHIEKLARDVTIVNLPSKPVAFVRYIGPYDDYESMHQTWCMLLGKFGVKHILSEGVWKISIPHDTPGLTPDEKLRLDLCVTLEGLSDFEPGDNIGLQTIAGGKYAVISYDGSIENIEETYRYLFGVWLPQSGMELADHPNFIRHKNLPATVEDDFELDIYLPLR